jgi:hypothetical protein
MRATTLAFFALTLVIRLPAQRATAPMDEWEALDVSLSQKSMKSSTPKNGFVPDASTAIKIAEAVAIAQWGEKTIAEERPFKARLRGNVWTVKGALHPQGSAGGTAVVQLSKITGAVMFAVHQN